MAAHDTLARARGQLDIITELRAAIGAGAPEMLAAAIDHARDANVEHLKIFAEAEQLLHEIEPPRQAPRPSMLEQVGLSLFG